MPEEAVMMVRCVPVKDEENLAYVASLLPGAPLEKAPWTDEAPEEGCTIGECAVHEGAVWLTPMVQRVVAENPEIRTICLICSVAIMAAAKVSGQFGEFGQQFSVN